MRFLIFASKIYTTSSSGGSSVPSLHVIWHKPEFSFTHTVVHFDPQFSIMTPQNCSTGLTSINKMSYDPHSENPGENHDKQVPLADFITSLVCVSISV